MRTGWSIIGHDQVFGHVHDLEQVDARLDAHAIAHGDEHFQRRVAGAGAEARGGAVDAVRARLERGERVGDAHARLWWPWKPSSVSGSQRRRAAAPMRARHVVGQHVARRVGARRCSWRHSFPSAWPAAPDLLGRDHVGHHQEADGVEAELARQRRCAARRRRPRCSAWPRGWSCTPQSTRHPQVIDGADAGQQQRRHLGAASSAASPRAGIPRRVCAGKP